MIGQKVSHYTIIEKIGSGGMGEVYKAEDTKLDRSVALKFLTKECCQNEESRKRFILEAKSISGLDHPNIAVVHEIAEVEGKLFICMRYYEGRTLKDIIAEEGPLPIENIGLIGSQIAQGLREAHNAGITHRDIKPANILITEKGEAKILDFGIAKLMNNAEMTLAGTVLGTVAYMSPEQIRGEVVDHRSDIFSLGTLFYEMTTGEHPFKGEYSAAITYSILSEDPPPVSSLRPEVPILLEKIIQKAMAKDVQDRYQTMDEVIQDLKALHREPELEKEIDHRFRKRIKVSRKINSKVMSLVLLSVIIVLLTMAGIFFDFGEAPAERLSLAVLPLESKTDDQMFEDQGWTLANALVTNLQQSNYLTLVSPLRIHDILRSMEISETELNNLDSAKEIAKRVNAQILGMGTIVKIANTFRIDYHLYDTNTWEVIGSAAASGEDINQLWAKVDGLGKEIRKKLRLPAKALQEVTPTISDLTTKSPDAYKFFVKGERAIADLYWDDAIASFKQAIALDSTFALAYGWLAITYVPAGRYSESRQAIQNAKKFNATITELERNLIELWGHLIDFYAQSTHKQDLIQLCRKLRDDYSEDERVLWSASVAYSVLGEKEEEVKTHYKILEINPNNLWSLNSLGYYYIARGMWSKAIEYLKKQIKAAPRQANPYDSLGDVYRQAGLYMESQEQYQKAEALKPNFSVVGLGEIFYEQGQFNKAKQYFEKAVEAGFDQNDKYDALIKLALLNRKIGGPVEEAKSQAEQAKQLIPERPDAYRLLGLINLEQGDILAARQYAHKIQSIKKNDSNYYNLMGHIYTSKNQHDQAIDEFEKAVTSKPTLENRYDLGLVLKRKGELEKATNELFEILQINPNHAPSRKLLGQIYEIKGEKELAKQEYEKFLEIWKEADKNIPELLNIKNKISNFK
jgi:serine/threonine protein kinase/tetratricopeptide (TPR) repeat protein